MPTPETYKQNAEWFTDEPQNNSDAGRFWTAFEIQLHKAIVTVEGHGHHPVIRVSERMFALVFVGKCTQVIAACWSVYMFRGYPIALRDNFKQWDVVEVLDEYGLTSYTFKVKT